MSHFELIMTLAIVGVLTTMATPSLLHTLESNRQTAQINNFVTSILLARSVAATQNHYVVVCPSLDQNSCQANASWSDGWIVRSSRQSADEAQTGSAAQVLRTQAPLQSIRLKSNRTSYLFRPYGKRATNGTMIFCSRHLDVPAKAIIVSYNGRGRRSPNYAQGGFSPCDP